MKKLWNHAIEIAKTISKKFDNPITLQIKIGIVNDKRKQV